MGDVAFDGLEDPPRLHVADSVGNEQYTLFLDSPVDPEPVPTDGFTYPVSDAVRVEVEGFELEEVVPIHLWNNTGELRHVADHDDGFQVPSGNYYLEICRPLKTYIQHSGPMSVEPDGDRMLVQFGTPATVVVGARSPRKRPAFSITTTSAPEDVMEAFSCLGEGLLTTTPSRSYPNLRGYPPEIRIGDDLEIPDDLDTGSQPVTLSLPPELAYLYEAAPLIYYLNADVRAGSSPLLLVDDQPIYRFDEASFAEDIERLLRHLLVLDCVVRTEGPYPIDSTESARLADITSSDSENLYHATEGTRLRKYLDVPFELVAQEAPGWPATAWVEPTVDSVESIPHLVAQLVPIRTASPDPLSGTTARRAALTAFTVNASNTRASSDVFDGDASFVDVGTADSNTDLWIGPYIPISANKFLVEGYRNRVGQTSSEQQSIDVTIVCNESWMSVEATTIQRYYDDRGELPFETSVHEQLDRDTFAAILESETDFLHYVGHATVDGLECTDGYLDVSTVSSVGVETFFLNACQSYRQASKLVEGGAIGGIATLSDVTDDQAAIVGRTAARLLNIGFPLRVALQIARSRSVVGGQYLAVGDDSITLVSPAGTPNQLLVTPVDEGYELEIDTFQTTRVGPGALYVPWTGSGTQRYLAGKQIGPFELTAEELGGVLELMNVPVEYDGEFRWAFDLAEELD